MINCWRRLGALELAGVGVDHVIVAGAEVAGVLAGARRHAVAAAAADVAHLDLPVVAAPPPARPAAVCVGDGDGDAFGVADALHSRGRTDELVFVTVPITCIVSFFCSPVITHIFTSLQEALLLARTLDFGPMITCRTLFNLCAVFPHFSR